MANIPVIMRILQLHCDNISYEATKKEIKSAEEIDPKPVSIDEVVVCFVAVEKDDTEDVAKDGITVNSTLTGYFDTDRIAQLNSKKAEKLGISPDEVRSNMEEQVPVKRIGDPKEYGYLVAFLASDQAAFITGTNIPIDGGLLKSL